MSIIAAGTTTTTALSSTGNTDGTLQLQVNGTTPSVTLNALGAVGVGASPSFGTSGQALLSAGSTTAPAWGNVQAPLVSGTTIKTVNSTTLLGSGDVAVQPTLVSGTNIKTVNSESLLGSGNISIPLTSPAGTTGQVQINSSGAFGAVSSGTTGQVLTSQGTGAAPVFATPAGGGAWTYISTTTASNASFVDITSGIDSTYDLYVITGVDIRSHSGDRYVEAQFFINGVLRTSSYETNYFGRNGVNFAGFTQFNVSAFFLNNDSWSAIENNSTELASMLMYLPKPSASWYKSIWGQLTSAYGNQVIFSGYNFGTTNAVTGIRLQLSGANISGTFRLYGIKNS